MKINCLNGDSFDSFDFYDSLLRDSDFGAFYLNHGFIRIARITRIIFLCHPFSTSKNSAIYRVPTKTYELLPVHTEGFYHEITGFVEISSRMKINCLNSALCDLYDCHESGKSKS